MQTSFMHPPFGFALFYLRSIAPKEVKSSAIYWPGLVTAFLDKPSDIDPTKLQIEIPGEEGEPMQYYDDLERKLRQAR